MGAVWLLSLDKADGSGRGLSGTIPIPISGPGLGLTISPGLRLRSRLSSAGGIDATTEVSTEETTATSDVGTNESGNVNETETSDA